MTNEGCAMKHITGELEPTPRKAAGEIKSGIKRILDVFTGEVRSGREDTILRSSAIGSCVVIAAYDPTKKVGALAHVMVPGAAPAGRTAQRTRYAVDAIEEMVNEMVYLGAEKSNIEACLVGGGNVLKRKDGTICVENISSVIEILKERHIPIRGKEIGGTERRTISLVVQTSCVHYTVGDSKVKLLWTFSSSSSGEGGEK